MIKTIYDESCLVLAGLGAYAVAAPVFGDIAAAKVIFGAHAVVGASRISLLPLLYFAKGWRPRIFPETISPSVIGFGGLHLLTNEDPLNYAVPAALITWLVAGVILACQGLDESVGNDEKEYEHRVWGPLFIRWDYQEEG